MLVGGYAYPIQLLTEVLIRFLKRYELKKSFNETLVASNKYIRQYSTPEKQCSKSPF